MQRHSRSQHHPEARHDRVGHLEGGVHRHGCRRCIYVALIPENPYYQPTEQHDGHELEIFDVIKLCI